MKSFDEHLADCRILLPSRSPIRVASLDALGFRLAEDVHATSDAPAFASSAMDGYAVRVADVPGTLTVVGEVAAGQVPADAVEPGTAVRIMTGAMIPTGTEAVVPVEDTSESDGKVRIDVATELNRHLRAVGDDLRAGDRILEAGRLIGPTQLAALVANRFADVLVHPRPRVAIVSTGDELVAPGETPDAAQLVDSNAPALAAAAAAAGADVVTVQRVSDDPDLLLAALDELADRVDLIVSTGGVSMGAYDVVKAALAPIGIAFEQVAMQPGKPQARGRYRGGPGFLGLPGNPVSALLSFELFGRAALGCERPTLLATLDEDVRRGSAGRRQFLRGRLDGSRVHVDHETGSHLIAGLARADCLIVVPEDVDGYPAGATVEVIPLG